MKRNIYLRLYDLEKNKEFIKLVDTYCGYRSDDNLKEIISDSFSIDLSNYKFQYYDNVEKDKNDENNENHNQKEIVDDEKSYKKFCKNNDKKKKVFYM